MSCVTRTEKEKKIIVELAAKFPKENFESIENFVGMWQEKYNRSPEDFPIGYELNKFIQEVRGNKVTPNKIEISGDESRNIGVIKVISGGQTGVDTIGLQVAKELGIETGGTAPKGFLRERGIDNEDISSYNLVEITDEEQADYTKRKGKTDPYTGRTELNVRNSDGTVYFYTSDDKSGMLATKRSAEDWNKPFITNPTAEQLKKWIKDNNIKTLNVAGNRGSKLSKDNNVAEVLREALSETLNSSEAQTVEEKASDVFATPTVTTVEEQEKVDLLFDPMTRRDRVTLIARFFSNTIDSALEEEKRLLRSKIDSAESQEEREELRNQLANLDRFAIIRKLTPAGIFKKVYNTFASYVNYTDEQRIQEELNTINADENALIEAGEIDESERYSEEEKLEAAKKRASHKLREFKKMVDDPKVFKALCEETTYLLLATEGIAININSLLPSEANLNNDDPEGNSNLDEASDDWSLEEAFKDGWMSNYRQVSSHESLSQVVRAAIRQIPKLDHNGIYELDDLGFTKYLDADYVHATLIDKLRYMIDSDDMIPLLTDLAKTKPWVEQIIEVLQEDESLFSQFYQDFRKDFLPYWIQKRKMVPDGTFTIETVSINKPEGTYYLLDSWRDNYESGTLLDNDSVYNKDGSLNIENASKGLKWVETLTNKFNNLSTEERLKLLEEERIWNTLMKLLHMLGIDANPSVLKLALTDIKTAPGITFTDPIMLLLPQLNVIFSGIKKGEIKDKTDEFGTVKRGDLINTFGSAYNSIANMLAEVTEDAIESSVRENGKSYFSHVTPSYLGKLIKNLKNVMKDKERFDRFMKSEFKNYEWFFKGGHWRNDWLRQLEESADMREGLNHKVLLNSDKINYTDWDSLDYTIVLLAEYWGEPDTSKKTKYAWYHVPILSDSPSAEFIRFRKYTTGDVSDEYGNNRTYDDVILDRLSDLVNQEYDRIMLIRERSDRYQNGDPSIEPIANYDILWDKKTGEIKSMGGAEFKFLPALNDKVYEDGKSFIDKLGELKSRGTGAELRTFIREAINDVMEEGFEQTYRDWMNMGLFEELPNGKFKNLSFKFKDGQSKQNAITAKALEKAKQVLGSAWTTNMELLLRNYKNNSYYNTRKAEGLMEEIKNIINDKSSRGELNPNEASAITRSLFVKNNSKEALREYYWNSKLATSQIIELTTTDLAFYKNVEDFQKRYKEIHAPSLRMNTKATYKGKRIGRDYERTIYLKDNIIVSSIIEDVIAVLDEKVKKGEMSKMDRDAIVYKFKEVNVADAQAYRSISSYRAILGMSGQWTDDMEKAYNNFKNGNWDISDFNIIWQTKKPFVYTQVNKVVGYKKKSVPLVDESTGNQVVDNEGNLKFIEIDDLEKPIYQKVPIQHKNSEFLLLAAHQLIAGPLGKSSKLRAINEFMEEHDIDVVQFESAVKVGKQSLIDLSDVNTEDDVIRRLREKTGIGTSAGEDPNVVHKISYEDYGIQTATPEHAIDAIQLVGTQIRKLITADISDDPNLRIEVDGKKFTKQEWLDLYNKINTENILQAFIDIDKVFRDPKEVEKIILEEVRSNQRYSMDMIRACTLDENGNFNIPLFDPVQSQRVQQLLNSIIKSRVTKQKIRGGALIQVSSFGLTDELKIVFEGEGENKRIKYLECYMPAYSREFYEPLMDPNTHQLDVEKLPEDLRRLIGYRVPTEAQYSMAPLRIKGFLPQQNGSAIMLPAEITTLSGSDFDIDKLYIMLPEFKILDRYRIKEAWDDFYADPANADIVDEIDKSIGEAFEDYKEKHPDTDLDIDDYIDSLKEDGIRKYQFSDTARERFREWFSSRRKQYSYGKGGAKIEKIKYDFNKSAKDNGVKARNNLLIDMMWGILTNADTTSKILNPGGFDYQKKAARLSSVLRSMTESELIDVLISIGKAPSNLRNYLDANNQGKTYSQSMLEKLKKDGIKYKSRRAISNGGEIIQYTVDGITSYLLDLDLDTLDSLAERFKSRMDPLSPETQVLLHQQNMTGAKMIGIYANHNANHAMMQHTDLELNNNGDFRLNGKTLTSLHNIENDDKEFISKNTAGFLAASVDNVKDPVLADLNQNTFTADATMLLSRLGYNPVEIGLLMNQPIVIEMTKAFFRESRNGVSKADIIDKVLSKWRDLASVNSDMTYDNYKNNQFYSEDLASYILLSKEAVEDRTTTSDYRKISYPKDQVAVGYLFKRIMNTADALGKVVQATRADTQNGAAGPSIADTMSKMQKVKDLLDEASSKDFPISNALVILDDIGEYNSESELRTKLLESPIPILQSFYTLGIKLTERMLKPYFPQYTESFIKVIDTLRDMTRRGTLDVKTMNNVYNDLMAYVMSGKDFFGAELMGDKIRSSAEKRAYFINEFPEEFKKIVSNNPDIAELEFIKRLKVAKADDNNPVQTLIFKNVGQLSPTLRERYMRDWTTLLYMSNPEAQKLALNLFRYSFYRNGFAFGPNTFIHLAPVAVRKVIPEYIDTLRSLLEDNDDYSHFIDQYIYNHLDNRKLVPAVPEESSFEFLDDKKNAKESITVTVDRYSSSADKTVVRVFPKSEEDGYTFFSYIGRRVGRDWVYYKLDESKSGGKIAVYDQIKPLGFKNSFIEYEYGENVEDMSTSIKEVKNKTRRSKATYDAYSSHKASFSDDTQNYEDNSILDFFSSTISEEESLGSQASRRVYGESFEGSTPSTVDLSTIEGNEDETDADGNKICKSF